MEMSNQKEGSQLVASKIILGEDPLNAMLTQKHSYHHSSSQIIEPMLEEILNEQERQKASDDSVSPMDIRKTMLAYDFEQAIKEEQPLDESETIQQQKEEMIYHESEKVEPVIERVRKSLIQKSQKKKIQGLTENEVECGEEQFMKLSKVKCDCISSLKIPTLEGDLIMTNYKLVFKYNQAPYILNTEGKQEQAKLPSFIDEYLKVPLSCISKIDKTTIDRKTNKINFLELYTKDFRYLKFSFENTEDCTNANLRIQFVAFPENEMHDIFAFVYFYPQQEMIQEQIGNDIYKVPELEFKRQGIDLAKSSVFRKFENQDYVVCATYPRFHILPSQIQDATLQRCSKFRTKNRFPSLTYYESKTGCSIWRSSQTMTGLLTNRSQDDELMLTEIARTNPNGPSKLVIYDARSYINAMANRINKGGFENTKEYYTNCEIEFCDIDNIHGVRDAITKVYDMSVQPQVLQNSSKWLTLLDSTNWLQIISKILSAVNKLLDTILIRKQNILVHCTDGWDRTAQLCALSQIMLDPFYRTIKGFEILIEKDWLSFGHMFQRRLGHYNKNYKDDQRCPIFIQFLDAVFQVLNQFPNQFEFNRNMLLFIATEIYTCKYGTFLCNSERERVKYNLREKTVSMWTYINHFSAQFKNPFYDHDRQEQLTQIHITNYFELKLWKELFFKYSEQPSYFRSPDINSPDDHKEFLMNEQRNAHKLLESLIDRSQSLLSQLKSSETTKSSTPQVKQNDHNMDNAEELKEDSL